MVRRKQCWKTRGHLPCTRSQMPRAARLEAACAFADQSGANIESQYVGVLAVRGALDEDFSTGTGCGTLRVGHRGAAHADAGTCGAGGARRSGESSWCRSTCGRQPVIMAKRHEKAPCKSATPKRDVNGTTLMARSRRKPPAAPVTYCSPCRRSNSSRSRCSGSWVSSSAQVSRSSMARWQPSRTRSRSIGTPLASANWIVSANCAHSSAP